MLIMNPDEELKVLLESFDELEDNLNHSKNSSKRKVSLTEDEPFNKMAKIPSIFYPLDMESILKKTPEGNVLLYNRAKLNNDYRNKLSKILVNELIFATGKSIKREAFVKVCEEIVQLFPNEVTETYYIPYVSSKHGLRKQAARGKLWSRYLNVRALLRMTSDPKKIESEVEGEREDSDELKNDLIFLESAVEPFVRILESWERTFDYRQNLFKEPSFEIDKIFNKFPCLKMPYALELFEADFNRIYPEKIDIVYSEGPKICRAIIKESEERKVSPFKEDIEDTNKKALFLLPYMFSPVTIKKGKSNSGIYRPTRKEVQESFFVQAEVRTKCSLVIQYAIHSFVSEF
ncbi:uncharacterized protein LOC123312369 [Coccinella septempunctata]|uniref:uncharacterized protein LOC123312369 n=1 Tax=Coccinella septempunctata TaxID=41139 RepID=UPI001D08613E|nr:uncharacterized protein LOC123312369 [Coccinella septempunctata]